MPKEIKKPYTHNEVTDGSDDKKPLGPREFEIFTAALEGLEQVFVDVQEDASLKESKDAKTPGDTSSPSSDKSES